MITEYPFDVPGNYLFDSNKIKVENGEASLKSLVKLSETCFCNFDSLAVKRSRDSGSEVVTPTGGADVSGKWLDLAHDDVRYIDIDADLNADSQQTGCIRFKIKPNYDTTPSSEMVFVVNCKANNDLINCIFIRHSASGALRLHLYDEAGNLASETLLAYWSPTLGQTYELETNYDFTNGVTQVFIDGDPVGAEISSTFTRNADIGLLRFGATYAGGNNSNFSITDIQIFDEVQHTSSFTSEVPRVEPKTYSTDNPTITTSPQAMDALEGFEATITKAGSDEIKHIINDDWFDTTWKDSNGTYPESNVGADIETNKATLDLAIGYNVAIKSFLHSEDGYSTPLLKNVKLTYNFFVAPCDDANECMISVRLDDIFQDLIDFTPLDAKFVIEVPISFQQCDKTVFQYVYEIDFDSTGYAEKSIRETTSVNKKIKFKITYKDQDNEIITINYKDAMVPDAKSKLLSEITSID